MKVDESGQDELTKELLRLRKWVLSLSRLLGLKLVDGQWVSWSGEKLAVESIENAITQEIIRSHELIRFRQEIEKADLSDNAKAQLRTMLNLTTYFITKYINEGPSREASHIADLVVGMLESFFPIFDDIGLEGLE